VAVQRVGHPGEGGGGARTGPSTFAILGRLVSIGQVALKASWIQMTISRVA